MGDVSPCGTRSWLAGSEESEVDGICAAEGLGGFADERGPSEAGSEVALGVTVPDMDGWQAEGAGGKGEKPEERWVVQKSLNGVYVGQENC